MEIYTKGILNLKDRLRATLRSLTLASVLSHSDNKRICDFRPRRSFAQIVCFAHNFAYLPAVIFNRRTIII